MAIIDPPAGLMDIASSLTQDEIPFKLRCAICNKLAVNAFRLPCCDQAICENCQVSLPESCPVCDHNPISPDLCKPNKALRTTLKAFLRTEEKKRERERPSTTPVTPTAPILPVDDTATAIETPDVTITAAQGSGDPKKLEAAVGEDKPLVEPSEATIPTKTTAEETDEANGHCPVHGQDDIPDNDPTRQGEGPQSMGLDGIAEGGDDTSGGDATQLGQQTIGQFPGLVQPFPNAMGFGMAPGMMANMGWTGPQDFNPMGQFIPNAIPSFPGPMGMPGMGMDPMAVAQGMFGGFGMNMNDMSNGMNMGMNFDAGQGMYGGWDSSQNNMWNGGQDKYNPTAFANGMGPDYGASGFAGGYNMSNGNYSQLQQPSHFPNQNAQNGYYDHGAGYGRGMGRGRGRSFYQGGRGRGGFSGPMNANHHYSGNHPNHAFETVPPPNLDSNDMSAPPVTPSEADIKKFNDELAPGGEDDITNDTPKGDAIPITAASVPDTDNATVSDFKPQESASEEQSSVPESQQLQVIPTIDSIDEASPHGVFPSGPPPMMEPGFGRARPSMPGGFYGGRGAYPNGSSHGPPMPAMGQGQGVAGAPAAPRAMRQGLPNTGMRGGRGFQIQGRASLPPQRSADVSRSTTPSNSRPDDRPKSPSPSNSRLRSRSRVRSQSAHTQSRARSPSPSPYAHRSRHHRSHRDRSETPHDSEDDRDKRRDRHRRKSRRDVDGDEFPRREEDRSPSPDESPHRFSHRRDRDQGHKSTHRSHRSRHHRSRSVSRNGESHYRDRESTVPNENGADKDDLASRISRNHRSSKEYSSRHDEDKDSKRRERERDRERRRDRDRDRDRDRNRDRPRERDRNKERDKDRKRSRRDRSESLGESDASRHHSRRAKRSYRDESLGNKDRRHVSDKDRSADLKTTKTPEPEKDAHTMEREARNRERMLKEQQRREAMNAERDSKGSRRRENRHDRSLTGGRRLSYRYEDEDDDMARIEQEREAGRWV